MGRPVLVPLAAEGAPLQIASLRREELVVDAQGRIASALADRYRIERELGSGGMATVYLAEDVRHRRQVAVKVLRPELAAVVGAERFLNEIEVTANLQHPHILQLYDSGEVEGFLYYVTSYVTGESLREKLNREKQLSVQDSIEITKAVASALDYAHRQDVIHRDIKPENILLQDGQAVVSDFGIALAISQAGGTRLTETGLSLGTPHYMSPEQAMGDRELDARSDVYSLACVTYEMLVGEPPYTGPTAQAVVAKVLSEKPPSLLAQRDTAPPQVDAAVQRALAKLPADRFATAQDFIAALTTPVPPLGARGTPSSPRPRSWRGLAVAAWKAVPWLLAVVFAVAAWIGLRSENPAPAEVMRFRIAVPTVNPTGRRIAISPDGRRLVYVGSGAAGRHLHLRSFGEVEPGVIEGKEGGSYPFFSDDGRWLGFFAAGALHRILLDAVVPEAIAAIPPDFRGASWMGDVIIFSALGNLWQVSSMGGEPTLIVASDTASGELGFRWPELLPDGETVLASVWPGDVADMWLEAVDVNTGQRTRVGAGTDARYTASGHLVYGRSGGVLMAAPFDRRTRSFIDAPVPVLSGVVVKAGGATEIAISRSGTLAYLPSVTRTLVMVDRGGAVQTLTQRKDEFRGPRFSPDGNRIAVDIRGQVGYRDIWILNLDEGTFNRRTFAEDNTFPSWSPDGRLIAQFQAPQLALTSPIGGEPTRVLQGTILFDQDISAPSWTPEGHSLVYARPSESTGTDLWILSISNPSEDRPLLQSMFDQWDPAVSPDGRWLAFTSNESGRDEVYVGPMGDPSSHVIVSLNGGNEPRWARNTGDLFYRSGDRVVRVVAEGDGDSFRVVGRTALFEIATTAGTWDVHPDGDRFVMMRDTDMESGFVVVLNWFDELKAILNERSVAGF